MSKDQPDTVTFTRILVALDASRHSRAALKAAATLAHISEAQLRGLFVQDRNWLKISRLSTSREISELTGDLRPLPEENMEKQIRRMENRIKDMLREISRHADISHSLKTVEGSIEQEILEASREADLITIGRAGHSYAKTKRRKLGKTARAIIRKAQKPVLLLQEGMELFQPIVAVYDGSEESQKGVRTALPLIQKTNGKLIVLALNNDSAAVDEERKKELEKLVESNARQVEVKLQNRTDVISFSQTINSSGSGLLIIPKNQPLVKNHVLDKLLDLIKCPILLMT